MKKLNWISLVFASLGAVLIVGTLILCFGSLQAPARKLGTDQSAAARTEKWMDAVCAGDYSAAGEMMYGQPALSTGGESSHEMGGMFWDAFVGSMSYEFIGDCYATQTGLAREVEVTALDISAVMAPLRERTEAIMEQRIIELEQMDEVYDENNQYRDTFVMSALQEAAAELLTEERFHVTRKLPLNLVLEDGQWWILPEQDLIDVLSGRMG